MATESQAISYQAQPVAAKASLSVARHLVTLVIGLAVTAAIAVAGTVVVTFALLAAVVLAPVAAIFTVGALVHHDRVAHRLAA